jgi:aldehyde dehydrogenase
MHVFQDEIFDPVVSATIFTDKADALRIGCAIQIGRVWINCYHLYPAHAAFGGYKQSSSFARTTR